MQRAGVFKPHKADGYDEQKRKILYIGKATAGEFTEADAVEWSFQTMKSHFWSFADDLSRLADPSLTNRENLVWSNVFKHGMTRGNPTGNAANEQRERAIEALKCEVKLFDPDLIVLVTIDYFEEIPKAAFNIADGESIEDGDGKLHREPIKGERYELWWRGTYKDIPAIVWMNHPQGKTRKYKDAALRLVGKVTGWTS